jgi:hypothetical protein
MGDKKKDFFYGIDAKFLLFWLTLGDVHLVFYDVSQHLDRKGATLGGLVKGVPVIS